MLSKFSKFFKIWRRLGWFWVRARRLGQGDLARSARRARARKSVVGVAESLRARGLLLKKWRVLG